jgi:hypothetical protein
MDGWVGDEMGGWETRWGETRRDETRGDEARRDETSVLVDDETRRDKRRWTRARGRPPSTRAGARRDTTPSVLVLIVETRQDPTRQNKTSVVGRVVRVVEETASLDAR